jgi:hypothetical protein
VSSETLVDFGVVDVLMKVVGNDEKMDVSLVRIAGFRRIRAIGGYL